VMQAASSCCGSEETIDYLFGEALQVVQKKDGYRFSLDALLLAGFVWLREGEKIVDLGTGVGIIPLILGARKEKVKEIVGVEIQSELADLATRNVFLNGFDGFVTIHHGDIKRVEEFLGAASFDVVVSNPPYYRVSDGRVNPHAEKALARHELACTVNDILDSSRFLLKEGGRLFLIFPAFRTTTLFDAMRKATLEPKKIRLVHSRENMSAEFVLAEGHKNRGEGVEVLPPLFIYADTNIYSSELQQLYATGTLLRQGDAQ